MSKPPTCMERLELLTRLQGPYVTSAPGAYLCQGSACHKWVPLYRYARKHDTTDHPGRVRYGFREESWPTDANGIPFEPCHEVTLTGRGCCCDNFDAAPWLDLQLTQVAEEPEVGEPGA